MFPEFAGLLRSSRSYSERAHLATGNDAAHRALNFFYEKITDQTDEIIEVYQGRIGAKIDIPVMEESDEVLDPIKVLREHLQIIEGVRYQAVNKDDSPIQNIIDEICKTYLRTFYKLEQLK